MGVMRVIDAIGIIAVALTVAMAMWATAVLTAQAT